MRECSVTFCSSTKTNTVHWKMSMLENTSSDHRSRSPELPPLCPPPHKTQRDLTAKGSYHILTSSVIYYWTDAWQLGIYLFNIYIYIFLRVFDIANQLLTRHSPIAPLGQVDEWTAKCSTFSIHGRLWDLSYIFSGFGNGTSSGWERKSTTNRFATGRFCSDGRNQ